ncbi:uncharacterized protein [Blastocystis hominis]|uniref:Uncharacterized protein n=1 Tax=Blastocystis hominis TaxID=12968 RepID=D8LWJ9_BLAHO|nr:uncharacterized protein [Blastocystis hominis]CBK20188.2 unnamed protein product [Blastocystis hominis]|eukprot:XP_012894236.1 uncharacterized protein [Blastocystis hominis]
MENTEATSAPQTESPQVTVVSQEEVNAPEVAVPAQTNTSEPIEVAAPAPTNTSEPETSNTAESGKEEASEESKEKWYDVGKFVMTPCGLGLITSPVDDNSVMVIMLTEGSETKKSMMVNGNFSIDSLEKAEVDETSSVAALLKCIWCNSLGQELFAQHHQSQAMAVFNQAIKFALDGKTEGYEEIISEMIVSSYFYMYLSSVMLKDEKTCSQIAQFMYELHPTHEMTIFCLAQQLIQQQQLSSAAQVIQSGLASNPESELLHGLLQNVLDTQLRTFRVAESSVEATKSQAASTASTASTASSSLGGMGQLGKAGSAGLGMASTPAAAAEAAAAAPKPSASAAPKPSSGAGMGMPGLGGLGGMGGIPGMGAESQEEEEDDGDVSNAIFWTVMIGAGAVAAMLLRKWRH